MGKDQSFEDVTTPVFRILHALSVRPTPIDIYVNDRKQVHSMAFGEITCPIEDSGESVTIAITKEMHPEKIIAETTVDQSQRSNFTLVLTEKNQKPHISIYRADPAPVYSRTKLRLIQLSPDIPAISISTEKKVLFSNVEFGDARFITLSACQSALFFYHTHTDQVIYRVPQIQLQEGETYSIFTVGRQTDPRFRLLVFKES